MRVRDVRDERAWGEFVALYTPIVYRFLRSRGLSGPDSEDVTQEVFRALAQALPNFQLDQSIGTFRNWLFTVTRSKLNTMLAKSQRLPQTMEELPDQGDAAADWEQFYMKELFRHACQEVSAVVEESSWQVFWRTAVELESPAQVASEMGLTVANVYQKKSRVALRLREAIQLADCEALSEPGAGAVFP